MAGLHRQITPRYALKWKEIGILLGVASEKLDIIEHDNFYRTEPCCIEMLTWWLRVDSTASWNKWHDVIDVIDVIESPLQGQAVDQGDQFRKATV